MGIGAWGKSLKLPYANEDTFLTQYHLISCKRPPRLDILGGRLWEV